MVIAQTKESFAMSEQIACKSFATFITHHNISLIKTLITTFFGTLSMSFRRIYVEFITAVIAIVG